MRGTSLLVYCVCETPGEPPPAGIRGIDGQPVYLVDDDGLSLVVSELPRSAGVEAADVSAILDFKNVVEVFHRAQTVLPFRFGCVLNGETRAREALRERRGEYLALLRRLDGCAEMGIRLLLPVDERTPAVEGTGSNSPVDGAAPARTYPGKRYLHARKALYREEESCALGEGDDQKVERCRSAFAGLHEDFRSEMSRIRGSGVRMASLVFLVKRDREEAFREAFRVLSREEGMKVLLSGPWPPYSFVAGEEIGK